MISDYEHVGEGEHPVIGLHGWFGSATAWRPLLPHLDGSRFHYVFPDHRGYGARKSVVGEYSLVEAAGDVLALADELGFDRFSLVGHSMGGIVMQRVLADAPERVRALVGVSPVPASGVPFDDDGWQLSAEPKALAMFDILTSQNRYAILHRINAAKRADTRARRIDQFVAMLARGETLYPQQRKLA